MVKGEERGVSDTVVGVECARFTSQFPQVGVYIIFVLH